MGRATKNALLTGENITMKSTGQTATTDSPASHTIASANITEPGVAKGSVWTKHPAPQEIPFPPPHCPLCRRKDSVVLEGAVSASAGGTDYRFRCEYSGCHTSPFFVVNWKAENFRFK
jgi:hypothetical protein